MLVGSVKFGDDGGMPPILAIPLVASAFALIGAVAARIRGRWALEGMIWGFFLGPVGLAVILLAADRRPKCRECRGVIPEGARKCMHCGATLDAVAAYMEWKQKRED